MVSAVAQRGIIPPHVLIANEVKEMMYTEVGCRVAFYSLRNRPRELKNTARGGSYNDLSRPRGAQKTICLALGVANLGHRAPRAGTNRLETNF